MDIEIAVGVRLRQVAVVDLLPGKLQRASFESRFIGSRYFRQWSKAPLKRDGSDSAAQVHPRFLVGDDHATVSTDGFVRACLLRMPVRVDQCVDAVVSGLFLDGLEQGVRIGG